MKLKEVTIYLNEEVLKDIEKLVFYLNATERENAVHTLETFIIGSIINKLENLDAYNELAKTFDDHRPYKLKNRFKEIADNLSISQKDISSQTGINPTTLNFILNNKHQPSLDNFFRLWVCLGYPPFEYCLYKELN